MITITYNNRTFNSLKIGFEALKIRYKTKRILFPKGIIKNGLYSGYFQVINKY
jgi:hypothetical protein